MTPWRIQLDKRISTPLVRSVTGRWLCAIHHAVANADSSILLSVAVVVAALVAVVFQVSSETFAQVVDRDVTTKESRP